MIYVVYLIAGIGAGAVTGLAGLSAAVETSTMIMTLVALTGAVSHISMGAVIYPLPMMIIVLSCLAGAVVSAKFANKCEIRKLNPVVGVVLLIFGIATTAIKVL